MGSISGCVIDCIGVSIMRQLVVSLKQFTLEKSEEKKTTKLRMLKLLIRCLLLQKMIYHFLHENIGYGYSLEVPH